MPVKVPLMAGRQKFNLQLKIHRSPYLGIYHMTSFLVYTDTHGCLTTNLQRFSSKENSTPDAIIHLGDFSNFGNQGERFFEECKEVKSPVFFVSGNHELPDLCRDIEEYYCSTCLDYSWCIVGDVLFVGLAGYDIFLPATRQENLKKFLNKLCTGNVVNGIRFSILLSHEPPWPWRYEGKTRGDEQVREILKSFPFNLVLTGHYHEDLPRVETESTIVPVINPSFQGCRLDIKPHDNSWKIGY